MGWEHPEITIGRTGALWEKVVIERRRTASIVGSSKQGRHVIDGLRFGSIDPPAFTAVLPFDGQALDSSVRGHFRGRP